MTKPLRVKVKFDQYQGVKKRVLRYTLRSPYNQSLKANSSQRQPNHGVTSYVRIKHREPSDIFYSSSIVNQPLYEFKNYNLDKTIPNLLSSLNPAKAGALASFYA